jgi:ABC-type dipeptide/oligopeptide/nickel transport system permease component
MSRLLLGRLSLLPILLVGVTLLAFLLVHLTPGDPARSLAGGRTATEAQVDRVRTEYGLDRSLPVQYVSYVTNVAQGDLGLSFIYKRPVSDLFRTRFPATLQLVIASLLIGTPLGLAAGVLAARRRDTWIDNVMTLVTLAGLSGPLFWIAYIFAWVFSVQLGLFPLGGQLSAFTELPPITYMPLVDAVLQGEWAIASDALNHLALPAFTLAIVPFALVARFTRASFNEVLGQDYITTARAYGIPERRIVWRLAGKNALLPVVTLFGILVPVMLVASLLAEAVFAWQGTGSLLIQAMQEQDYAVVQGIVLILGALFVVSNALVDISYTILDPRTRRR